MTVLVVLVRFRATEPSSVGGDAIPTESLLLLGDFLVDICHELA
jgi:hypothetical protein